MFTAAQKLSVWLSIYIKLYVCRSVFTRGRNMSGPGDHPLALVALTDRTDREEDAQDNGQCVLQCQDQVRPGHVWYCGQCTWTCEGHSTSTTRGPGPVDRQPVWIPTGKLRLFITKCNCVNLFKNRLLEMNFFTCWFPSPHCIQEVVSMFQSL